MAAVDGNHRVLAFQSAVVIFDGKGVFRSQSELTCWFGCSHHLKVITWPQGRIYFLERRFGGFTRPSTCPPARPSELNLAIHHVRNIAARLGVAELHHLIAGLPSRHKRGA